VQIDEQGNEFALTSSGLNGIVKYLFNEISMEITVLEESRRLFTTFDYRFTKVFLERLFQKIKENDLTNPRKEATIRISINYRSVPGNCEPAFVGLADLHDPPHKWHGFRIFAHNPEVSGSNPLPATLK
jgi:hypothetical protein